MNTLTWIGVVLMAVGTLWAIMMWAATRPWAAPQSGVAPTATTNPVVAIIGAIAQLFKAAAELLRLSYGAPALVFLGGLVLVVLGQT
jgi:hypothetical protein